MPAGSSGSAVAQITASGNSTIVPSPTDNLTYGPGLPGPAPSGGLGGVWAQQCRTLVPMEPQGGAAPVSTLLPAKTAILSPLHPPTTALVVVPITTNLPTRMAEFESRTDGNFAWVIGANGIVECFPGHKSPGCADFVAQSTPPPVNRKGSGDFLPGYGSILAPRAVLTPAVEKSKKNEMSEIEHGSWIRYYHDAEPLHDDELGPLIPIDSTNENVREEHGEATTNAGLPLVSCSDVPTDVASLSTMIITKTLKRTSSTPTSRPIATPASTIASAAHKTDTSSSSHPQIEDVHTSIVTADPRCPYPYPHIYCGEPKTTLVTISKALVDPSPASFASKTKEIKESKKMKGYLHPGEYVFA